MNPEIRTTPLAVTLLGASQLHDPAKSYGQEIKALLDRVWPAIRAAAVPNKGINWVVYDGCDRVFAGVEAQVPDPASLGLERMDIRLDRHAVCKHVGPYSRLGEAYTALKKAIEARGLRAGWPQIEVYGHWSSDESKLETDLIHPIA